MSVWQSKINVPRLTGGSLFVSGHLPSDAACTSELVFSFFNCAAVPQEPQITVSSDGAEQSDYTVVAEAARDFCGWLTVTAYAVIRSAVRAFRRVVCEVKAFFYRRTFIFQGELRL